MRRRRSGFKLGHVWLPRSPSRPHARFRCMCMTTPPNCEPLSVAWCMGAGLKSNLTALSAAARMHTRAAAVDWPDPVRDHPRDRRCQERTRTPSRFFPAGPLLQSCLLGPPATVSGCRTGAPLHRHRPTDSPQIISPESLTDAATCRLSFPPLRRESGSPRPPRPDPDHDARRAPPLAH